MGTVTLRKHRGIDRSVRPFELQDGQYWTLKNLWPTEEALPQRPGQIQHLTTIGASSVLGLTRFYRKAAAAPAGPNSGTAAVSDSSYGTYAWANPSNALSSNDQYAAATSPQYPVEVWVSSEYLKVTGFNFTVPTDATVVGVKVEVEGRSDWSPGGLIYDDRVRLVKAGVIQSHDKARSTSYPWPLGDEYWSYGGSTDLWGTTWTPAEVNASNFGVAIAAKWVQSVSGAVTARIDHVRVTVYYLPAGDPGKETLAQVATGLYSDKSGAWAAINGGNPLSAIGRLETVVWKSILYIQDGQTGPWKYDGTTFAAWTAGSDPPPRARYVLLDVGGVTERLYAAYLMNPERPTAIAACHADDADKWETVALPSGAEGMLAYAGRDDGDYITGLRRYATWKMILKKRSIWRLAGDNADTWDLAPLFPVGCAAHRLAWDCGGTFVWTDGRKVYSFNGSAIDMNFGKAVEPFLELTALDDWVDRTAVYWQGLYFLWYATDKCVAYDFRAGEWYGPWEGIPCGVAVVDRDSDLVWFGSSQEGKVAKLDGATDFGAAIAWEAESKHYDFGGAFINGAEWFKRARRLGVVADGAIGTVTAKVISDGVVSQERSLAFSGSSVQRLVAPLRQGPDGVALGLFVQGSGQGKIYEMALTANRLRKAT